MADIEKRLRRVMRMDGLYLYCLREKTGDSRAMSAKGIDGKEDVFILPYRRLEAIVSRVSLAEFGSEEIQRKAREDLSWIKEKALIHEGVIEEAMGKGGKILSLIPMRFGTVFKEKTKIEETLDKDYIKFEEVMDRIRGKQEWSAKVYLKDKGILEQGIKENNETIKEKVEEIAALPEGIAFFMEEEVKRLVAEELDMALSNSVNGLFDRLASRSAASIKSRILAKELTGRDEPMVLNSAYLIPEDDIDDFKKEAEAINQEIQAKGLYLEYSGPWPGYNFSGY